MRKALAAILALCIGATAWAAPTPAARAEIDHLFAYLQSSGCAFNRNGFWYSAEEAAGHLRTKYAYLLEWDLVSSAESFVKLAATRSSMTGRPYWVRCGNTAPVESAAWFGAELARYREGGAGAGR